jgi:hypothetical protein
MIGKKIQTRSAVAILTMAEIKAATDGFNSGKTNVFDALDSIIAAVDAYRSAALPFRKAA